jgi:aminopeptidase-like protein
MKNSYGKKIYSLIKLLFPFTRSLTGDGNKKTLDEIKKIIPKLKILKFKSGTKVFDWKIPEEWNIKKAYIICPDGKRIADYKESNLNVVNYSVPIRKKMDLNALKKKIFYLKELPNAVPYVTSYYHRDWGFCMSYNKFKNLKSGEYNVVIDSKLDKKGNLIIGEYFIKGKSKKEILISTNICHPSLVNNELTGPSILTYLIKKIENDNNFYSVRIIFVPETIGILTYLSKNLKNLKKNFHAGFHLTCFGDNKQYSMIETKFKDSYSDKIAKLVLQYKKGNKKVYDFHNFRGSDERQYNSPGINLPVVTLMRSKFGSFKEYHTSLDNLSIVSEKSLLESLNYICDIVKIIQKDFYIFSQFKGEPFFAKRNLYRSSGVTYPWSKDEKLLFNIFSYADGITLSDLSIKLKKDPIKLIRLIEHFKNKKMLKTTFKFKTL